MAATTATCTGCSLLCDDIEVALTEGRLSHVKNLCRKGYAHFQSAFTERTDPVIDGEKATFDQAISRAAEILKNAKSPLLYGWSNCTLEAQAVGIKLAEKLGATIDDTSSFCQGILVERILDGRIPTCTLDDVRNYADTSIFWGGPIQQPSPPSLPLLLLSPGGEEAEEL